METNEEGYVVALDVGERRIGVAITHSLAALPKALTTLENDTDFWPHLLRLLDEHQAVSVVVGLPRDMTGKDTEQTAYVRRFVQDLKRQMSLPIYLQDEAVTSVVAEENLTKSGKGYNKGMVDAEAAAIILQDFMTEKNRNHG